MTRATSNLRPFVLWAAVLAAVPRESYAEPAPVLPGPGSRAVIVQPPACPAGVFPLAGVLDCLRVELAGRGLACCGEPDSSALSAALLVRMEIVPCASAADLDRVRVSVREQGSGREIASLVSLADVAETARPRALALAVAELIRSLQNGPEPVPAASAPPEPVSRPPAPSPQPIGSWLELMAEGRTMPEASTTIWGGRLLWSVYRRHLHADVDVGGGYGRAPVDLGAVVWHSGSAGLDLGPRLALPRLVLDLGVRAELGWLWARGESSQPNVLNGSGSKLTSSVGLRAALAIPARSRVGLGLSIEGGEVVRGVRARAGEPATGMAGYYLLAALGLRIGL